MGFFRTQLPSPLHELPLPMAEVPEPVDEGKSDRSWAAEALDYGVATFTPSELKQLMPVVMQKHSYTARDVREVMAELSALAFRMERTAAE